MAVVTTRNNSLMAGVFRTGRDTRVPDMRRGPAVGFAGRGGLALRGNPRSLRRDGTFPIRRSRYATRFPSRLPVWRDHSLSQEEAAEEPSLARLDHGVGILGEVIELKSLDADHGARASPCIIDGGLHLLLHRG